MRALLATMVRIVVSVGGGYAATSGIVSALAVVLFRCGLTRSEAVVLASMLGFGVYLGLLLWGIAAPRLWRFALGLALLAGGGFAVAWLMHGGVVWIG